MTGKLIYQRPRQKWAGPSMDDQSYVEELYLLLRRLCVNVGRVLLVSPLGIGHHVNHVITAQTALRLSAKVSRLLFYEDFPYVVDLQKGDGNGESLAAMARLGMEPSARLWLPIDAEKKPGSSSTTRRKSPRSSARRRGSARQSSTALSRGARWSSTGA